MIEYLIFLLIICVLICITCIISNNINYQTELNIGNGSEKSNSDNSQSLWSKQEIHIQECSQENAVMEIHINKDTYEKMVDIVTNYSMVSADYNEKKLLIYLSTFHLFDMNYGNLTLKNLDQKIKSYPYFPNNTEFPTGNMYSNLQKAIITHITMQIENSEKVLLNDKEKDRVVIDTYLYNLFTGIGIM